MMRGMVEFCQPYTERHGTVLSANASLKHQSTPASFHLKYGGFGGEVCFSNTQ